MRAAGGAAAAGCGPALAPGARAPAVARAARLAGDASRSRPHTALRTATRCTWLGLGLGVGLGLGLGLGLGIGLGLG